MNKNQQEAIQVATDVLLSAGSKQPVVCFEHEPYCIMIASSDGNGYYVKPDDEKNSIIKYYICKNCKCMYMEDLSKIYLY
jgi:hypothetical protein